MNKTNIHDINQDTSKSQKKTTSRKGITTGIMLTAGVLATNLSEGQNTHISTQQKKDTNEYTLIQNDTIQQNNDTVSFGPDNDTLDYRTYFDYPIKRVIDEFGEEKALEIIQYNLLLEINDSRKEMGVNPLILDKNLIKASQSYTKEMAKNKRLSHTGKNGSDATQRAQKAGYKGKFFVGENIGQNYYSIKQAIQERRNSNPHFAKIKDPQWKILGIGYYDGYRVLMFAK